MAHNVHAACIMHSPNYPAYKQIIKQIKCVFLFFGISTQLHEKEHVSKNINKMAQKVATIYIYAIPKLSRPMMGWNSPTGGENSAVGNSAQVEGWLWTDVEERNEVKVRTSSVPCFPYNPGKRAVNGITSKRGRLERGTTNQHGIGGIRTRVPYLPASMSLT